MSEIAFCGLNVSLRASSWHINDNHWTRRERSKKMKQSQCILTSNTRQWDAGHALKDGKNDWRKEEKMNGGAESENDCKVPLLPKHED